MNYFGSRPAGLNYWTGRTEAHSHDDILGIPEISGAPNMPAISPEVSSGYFGDPYAKDDTPTTGGGGGGGGPGSLAAGALAFGPTLLSGANTLSKFATDKSLLEHGADLLRPDPVNGIIQNNPIESAMDLFGFGPQSARAELTTALHPTGDIGNISGLPFDGGGATGLMQTGTPFEAAEAVSNFVGPLTQGAAANAALFASGPVAAAATAEAATAAALGIDLFGGLGVPAAATFGAPTAAGATAATAAGAGGLAGLAPILGPAAVIALPFIMSSLFGNEFDPTAETRRLNQLENLGQDGAAARNDISGFEQAVFSDPSVLALLESHTTNPQAPFGTDHTNGGTTNIGWSPAVNALIQNNLPALREAAAAGSQDFGGNSDHDAVFNNYHPKYNPDPNTYVTSVDELGQAFRQRVYSADELFDGGI